ncbi:MAG: tetratricopeptide repeat protein [Gemmatimonadales bacterium]
MSQGSFEMINEVKGLANEGRFAEVVALLERQPRDQVEESPTLALLFGTAHARLGRHDEGDLWVARALERSTQSGDNDVKARALNVLGAIALEDGRIEDAAGHFASALDAAKSLEDHVTLGLSSNNLGIVANLRGEYGTAIGSYTIALAAFQQADMQSGVAMIHHNRAITFRDEGKMAEALDEANRAVDSAASSNDVAMHAQALAGRAELRVLDGDVQLASKDIEGALSKHREIDDSVGVAEDTRIKGLVAAADGSLEQGKTFLRFAADVALRHGRPLLIATACKDLARLLADEGNTAEAIQEAQKARALFSKLGATVEVDRIDRFIEELAGK